MCGRRAGREVVIAVGDERRQGVHVGRVLHHRDLVGLQGEGEKRYRSTPTTAPKAQPQSTAPRKPSPARALFAAGFGAQLSGVWGHIPVGFGAAVLTRCAGDGERLSFSVAPAGTSNSGHFICRYCQGKGLSAQHPRPHSTHPMANRAPHPTASHIPQHHIPQHPQKPKLPLQAQLRTPQTHGADGTLGFLFSAPSAPTAP